MEIRDAHTSCFVRLTPTGYEFRKTVGDPDDDNWLNIKGRIRSPEDVWTFHEPALQVPEAEAIGAWLRDAAAGRATPLQPEADGSTWPAVETIEPVVSVGLVRYEPTEVSVRFFLWLEAARPGRRDYLEEGDTGYFLDITTTPEELERAAAEWESELAAFPYRGAPEGAKPRIRGPWARLADRLRGLAN